MKYNIVKRLFLGLLIAAPILTPMNAFAAQNVDSKIISDWAKPAVSYGVENKIIGGNADGTFNPQGKTSKEQAMSMVNNMLGGVVA